MISFGPTDQVYVAVEFSGYSPSDNEIVTVRVTSAPKLHTLASDTPASATFRSRLAQGALRSSFRLTQGNAFTGAGSPGTVELDILDPEATMLPEWRRLRWKGRAAWVAFGSALLPDGTPRPWSSWQRIWAMHVESVRPGGQGVLKVTLQGAKQGWSESMTRAVYRGFGGALRLSSSGIAASSDAAALNLPAGGTVEWVGRLTEPPASRLALLRRAFDYGLEVTSSRSLEFVHSGGTRVACGYTIDLGQPFYAGVSIGPTSTGHRALVYAGPARANAVILRKTIDLASLPMTSGGLTYGGGGESECWEARLWPAPRSADEMVGLCDRPISGAIDLGVVECWKFEDNTGSTAAGEVGVLDLSVSGGYWWVASLEGDDPEAFEGGPVGDVAGLAIGLVSNIPAVAVDTPRRAVRWAEGVTSKLVALRQSGAPMVPRKGIKVGVLGDISISSTGVVALSSGSGLSASGWVAGQAEPARLGQRIQISSSAGRDGVYRVGVDGISGNGLLMQLVADDGSALSGIPAGNLPVDAELFTPGTSEQYWADLGRSSAYLIDPAEGELTVDAVFAPGPGATLSQAIEEVIGHPVENDLDLDPVVGVYWGSEDSAVAISDAVDILLRSGLAYADETSEGGIRLGSWRVPAAGDAAAVLTSGSPQRAAVSADQSGRISEIREIEGQQPSSGLRVGYGRTWSVMDRGAVAGQVPSSTSSRLTTKFRWVDRAAPLDTLRDWPSASKLADIETALVNRSDAELVADRAVQLFCRERRWFSIETIGLSIVGIPRGSLVWVQHDDPSYDIVGGVWAIVVATLEEPITGRQTIEVYT